ncbi:MAG TPA: twin-arginine translocation signal domain-containing protein [Gemmatimonadaceae bacterium]
MSGDQLTRRDFLTAVGWTAAGASLASMVGSCGGGDVAPAAPRSFGRVSGVVTDLAGTYQPSLGTIYLMYPAGQQSGRLTTVDPAGEFHFDDVPPGDWQIRFSAPGRAYVPEPLPHPIRFSVETDQETFVTIKVERGVAEDAMHEIYVGDFFFQEQPAGRENTETVVRLGESVCWYNVGLMQHTVTGGPWTDSGTLNRAGNFVWIPDRVGVFGYRCAFHPSQMIATLRVIP